MKTRSLPKHIQVVLIYVFLAALWVLVTDYLIARLIENPELLVSMEGYKGFAFIVITAVFLYFERMGSDRALQRNAERFRVMAEFTYDWEYWLGTDGHFKYVSPSCRRITGYTAEEFLRDPGLLENIIHPEDHELFVEHLKEEHVEEYPSSIEFRIINRKGEEHWIGHVCQRVYGNRGDALGIRASNRDITRRRKYQESELMKIEELAQAEKMITLGTLVSGVAHEINNPTHFIALNTPLLRETWHGTRPILDSYYRQNGEFRVGRFKYSLLKDRVDQLLDGVDEGARRIQRIVNSLKDYARPDPSDMNQIVDINEVIQNAITLLANPIENQTNRFSANLAESLPRIRGSSQKLEQVLINLIQNALESLEAKDKSVSVSSGVDALNHRVIIEVKDEGCGMEDKTLRRVLDPFYTTKRSKGGTGLGLAIAARIAQDHGGQLTFTSEVGKGTTALLTLNPMPE
ncbi:MAG: PAS domain S-box protein [Spirochaetales bacterium]|nr:PAS domain S-box protein [Spirochaetales bacterium]